MKRGENFLKNHSNDLKMDKNNVRGQIIGLWMANMSTREIADRLNISHTTAARWINRFKQSGHVQRKDGSGRPHILTDDEAMDVIALSVVDPFLTAEDIKRKLSLDVTAKTIRNVLREAGLYCRRSALKPLLTDVHKKCRLDFARAHINWGVNEWDSVLFTDESLIQSFKNQTQMVYRPMGSRFEDHYISHSTRSGRISVAVWSCMSSKGLGDLHKIEGRLTSIQYKDILEHIMVPQVIDNFYEDGYFLLQQDNCSVHTSSLVQNWLSESGINILKWPSRSPDLNPIENVWGVWKRKIETLSVKTETDLINEGLKAWNSIKINTRFVNNLLESMPSRLQEVIDNNGGPTSY